MRKKTHKSSKISRTVLLFLLLSAHPVQSGTPEFTNQSNVVVSTGDTILSDNSQGQDTGNIYKLYDGDLATGFSIPSSLGTGEQYIEFDWSGQGAE